MSDVLLYKNHLKLFLARKWNLPDIYKRYTYTPHTTIYINMDNKVYSILYNKTQIIIEIRNIHRKLVHLVAEKTIAAQQQYNNNNTLIYNVRLCLIISWKLILQMKFIIMKMRYIFKKYKTNVRYTYPIIILGA